ncbi:MAG: replication restart helicase PriA [Bacteroidales bacterium]
MRQTLFVDVLLPLPVDGYFTYRVPFDMNGSVKTGIRVAVQFGKKKLYTALVRSVHEKPPMVVPKYILAVMDEEPIVNEIQFSFWEWMAIYYMCAPGEIMNAALPPGFKLTSETRVILNPANTEYSFALSEKEQTVIKALIAREVLTLGEVADLVEHPKVLPLIKTMIEKGLLLTEETLEQRYKPRTESFVTIAEEYLDEDRLREVYDKLERKAGKQLQVLIAYISMSHCLSGKPNDVKRAELLKANGASPAALKTLEKKGILISGDKIVSRLEHFDSEQDSASIQLNSIQQEALDTINAGFAEKDVFLLHGVTSSGKTELYIRLIADALAAGKQVLYLLPEIALTTQIINRLRRFFGSSVGIYHSRFNENERAEIWNSVIAPVTDTSPYRVILGARSAVFLPFSKLGLIIVDEEHDTSFKQYDPAPRYNARDAAIYLAGLHKAKTLLGSATPAIETYANALNGKFGLAGLSERFGGMLLPTVQVVNLKEETKFRSMKSVFSAPLVEGIQQALDGGEQVILFQNRRGFSLRLECNTCFWTPECKNCDVTLIYHKRDGMLRCHYCGYAIRVPDTCPDCGHTGLMMKGFGTERVEEDLALLFPAARIERMDLDTTRSRYALQQLIADFEDQRIDILVGTQMVTKGLDFENVSLVGILNADNMISFPDFRSFERSYQLMAQVSGRAGRKKKQGRVIIQTYNPGHAVIRQVCANDYAGMYQSQMTERHTYNYPPYFRLIRITLKHRDARHLDQGAAFLATLLHDAFGQRVLGPEFPAVSRIRNLYLKNFLIKIEKGAALARLKFELATILHTFAREKDWRQVIVAVDVDPV